MNLRHIEYSTAQPPIPRDQVPSMREWLAQRREEAAGKRKWWRR
jgi:hypothetical protein